MDIEAIGIFSCAEAYPYDAARQGVASHRSTGVVELYPGRNYEQALLDLDGFSHIWLVFQFHKNQHWKPMVQPPRGERKVGVFASRAPYRPNGIGMSCVRLTGVCGRQLEVSDHDLLDGTPILDIKPYLSYADSFPEASMGWLEESLDAPWEVEFSDTCRVQLGWLTSNGVERIGAFLVQQLTHEPLNKSKKRVRLLQDKSWEIAYRTWRATFAVDEVLHAIVVIKMYTGYSCEELDSPEDKYQDKDVHRNYKEEFGIEVEGD